MSYTFIRAILACEPYLVIKYFTNKLCKDAYESFISFKISLLGNPIDFIFLYAALPLSPVVI